MKLDKKIMMPVLLVPSLVAICFVAVNKSAQKTAVAYDPLTIRFDLNSGFLNNMVTIDADDGIYQATYTLHSDKYNQDYDFDFIFEYFEDSRSESAFGTFYPDGRLIVNTKIPGITSVSLNYTCMTVSEDFDPEHLETFALVECDFGCFDLGWWWDAPVDLETYYCASNHIFTEIAAPAHSMSFDFMEEKPNFFSIDFELFTIVNSIEISYECSEGEIPDSYATDYFDYRLDLTYNDETGNYDKELGVLGFSKYLPDGLYDINPTNLENANKYGINASYFCPNAFNHDPRLKSLIFSEEFNVICLDDCENLETVFFPNNLASLDFYGQLEDCPNLTSIYLGKDTNADSNSIINCQKLSTFYTNATNFYAECVWYYFPGSQWYEEMDYEHFKVINYETNEVIYQRT